MDRYGQTLQKHDWVAVLPFKTRDDATRKEIEELGAEFCGSVVSVADSYVSVAADDPMRGIVEIRQDLVIKS